MANDNSIDSLLDGQLDDLADLPEFKPYPAGAHKFNIGWSQKTINDKQGIVLTFKGIETVELANPNDPDIKPITPGQETQILFLFKNNDGSRNEIAEGLFKDCMNSLREKFFPGKTAKEVTARQVMEASEGAECVGVTAVKVNKNNDPPTKNTQLKSLVAV